MMHIKPTWYDESVRLAVWHRNARMKSMSSDVLQNITNLWKYCDSLYNDPLVYESIYADLLVSFKAPDKYPFGTVGNWFVGCDQALPTMPVRCQLLCAQALRPPKETNGQTFCESSVVIIESKSNTLETLHHGINDNIIIHMTENTLIPLEPLDSEYLATLGNTADVYFAANPNKPVLVGVDIDVLNFPDKLKKLSKGSIILGVILFVMFFIILIVLVSKYIQSERTQK
jgi:hypothetical protein